MLYFSAYVIAEVRDVASRPRVMAKLHLEAGRVDRYCQAVQLSGVEVKDVPGVFSYPRDPDDAHYVELAMAAGASYIVTWDRDLLDLMDTARAEGRDFMMYFGGVKI